jgi:hypothetical protein
MKGGKEKLCFSFHSLISARGKRMMGKFAQLLRLQQITADHLA